MRQLVTASLDEGIILPGITRRSVLELAHERFVGELQVVERMFEMKELASAAAEGGYWKRLLLERQYVVDNSLALGLD